MSIALFALAESSLAQVELKPSIKKAPPKRQMTALADPVLVAEPR